MKQCETCKHRHEILANIKNSIPEDQKIEWISDFFKVLGDPTRMRILIAIFEGEMSVSDISETLNMSVSAISHQLKILKTSKLVTSRKSGKRVYYMLFDAHVQEIIEQAFNHYEH